MKQLKTYEMYIDSSNVDENSELLKKYSYKIGDYIKMYGHKDDIVQIVAINTEDSFQPYQIKDDVGLYWISGGQFERPSKEELENFLREKDANKYNL